MAAWSAFVEKVKHPRRRSRSRWSGTPKPPDAYKSICESSIHAGAVNDCKVKLRYVNSRRSPARAARAAGQDVRHSGGSGALGNRGIEGKIEAVRFARENNIPFLGICLGSSAP